MATVRRLPRRPLTAALVVLLVVILLAGVSAWWVATPDTLVITVTQHTRTYTAPGPVVDHQITVFSRTIHSGSIARRVQGIIMSVSLWAPGSPRFGCGPGSNPFDVYSLYFFHAGILVESASDNTSVCAPWTVDRIMLRCCPTMSTWDSLSKETGAPLPIVGSPGLTP